jgi:hypothetical protein
MQPQAKEFGFFAGDDPEELETHYTFAASASGTVHQANRIASIQLLVPPIPPDGFNNPYQLSPSHVEPVQIKQLRKHICQILRYKGIAYFFMTLKEGLNHQQDCYHLAVRKAGF